MHPILTAQLAHEHRRDLHVEAARAAAKPPVDRRSLRTVMGLALVRAGLRISHPLTPADLGAEAGLTARPAM